MKNSWGSRAESDSPWPENGCQSTQAPGEAEESRHPAAEDVRDGGAGNGAGYKVRKRRQCTSRALVTSRAASGLLLPCPVGEGGFIL